ncbi:MAG: TPM domain-containing protein [Luteolibacter sp.]
MEKLRLSTQMTIFLRIIISLLLVLPVFAQSEPPFEYGPRPPVPLFDPEGFLTPDQASKVIGPLEKVRKNDKIDVIAVVLPDLGDAPPKYVAQRFGDAWCDPNVHAVVLFSPNQKGGPWIVPGGKFLEVMKPGEVEKKIDEARRRSAREPYDSSKIISACTEATDLLRYWTGGLITQGETFQIQRGIFLQERERQKLLLKSIGLAAACAIIPVALFAWWLVRRRGTSRPCHFPNPEITHRLGAPYGGGNSVTLELETRGRR